MYIVISADGEADGADADDDKSVHSAARARGGDTARSRGGGVASTHGSTGGPAHTAAASLFGLQLRVEASEKDVLGLQSTQPEVLRNLHRTQRFMAALKRYVGELEAHIETHKASPELPSASQPPVAAVSSWDTNQRNRTPAAPHPQRLTRSTSPAASHAQHLPASPRISPHLPAQHPPP